MKNLFFTLFGMLLVASACTSEKKADPFSISKNQVGLLTNEVPVNKLDSVFANDSIVKRAARGSFSSTGEIIIFDKKGNELLLLDPVQAYDSTSTIANIQIKDKRYKTDKGLSTASTFKDIVANYKISRIENTLSTAVIFLDDINAYVTIDKENIKGDARYNTDSKIEPTQIPDDAPIKHFWIGWE